MAGAPTELGNVVPHWHAVLSHGGPWRGHAAAGKQVCADCRYNEVQDLQVLSTTDSNAQLHPSMTDVHRRNHADHGHIMIVAAHPMWKSPCKGGIWRYRRSLACWSNISSWPLGKFRYDLVHEL